MKTIFANITLQIETDGLTEEDIRDELLDYIDHEFGEWMAESGSEIVDSQVNVEESKHGFRVQDSDGNWCEPSDAFAEMVKRDREFLARKKEERNG